MPRKIHVLSVALTLLVAAQAEAQKTVAFKSPGPGMHFTEGLPLVVFFDLFDGPGSGFGTIEEGPGGELIGWPQLELLIDGVRVRDEQTGLETIQGGTERDPNGNPTPVDLYRLEVVDVAAGTHELVGHGLFQDGTTEDTNPISITVDPWPTDKEQITFDADTALADLDWDNVAVTGNGATLEVSGSVNIRNSLITGITLLTGSVTDVDIEDSIFEDTGRVELTASGALTVLRNEFRANNRLTFVPSDPGVPIVISLSGSESDEPKLFQSNRVAAGQLDFRGMTNLLVGGETDELGNVLMGPRCVINVTNSSDVIVRGNFARHNYRGGWSQGFNFIYFGSSGVLTEHNLIWGASWPVQDVPGEFRYNLVYGYGHNWVRTVQSGTSIHHNLFVPESGGGLGEGIWTYEGETGIVVYNNTFDGGGPLGDFAGPTIRMSGGAEVASFRNNLVTFSRNLGNDSPGSPRVTSDDGSFGYVDYNAFYSPDNDNKDNYEIETTLTEGSDGFGAHDVSGEGELGVIDGQLAASPFEGERIFPLEDIVDEAAVWQGTQRLSDILATFRERYLPTEVVADRGDPADDDAQGNHADIGAIDRDEHDQDLFGKFGSPLAAAGRSSGGSPSGGSNTGGADGGSAAAGGGASGGDAGESSSGGSSAGGSSTGGGAVGGSSTGGNGDDTGGVGATGGTTGGARNEDSGDDGGCSLPGGARGGSAAALLGVALAFLIRRLRRLDGVRASRRHLEPRPSAARESSPP